MFLFISNPYIKLITAILYILVTYLSGFRVKLLPNILLFISILIVSLFSPVGLVITNIGPITITLGAFEEGLNNSALLIGLLYLSKHISMSNIKFKGTTGILIRDTFHYFNQLTSGDKIKFKGFIEQIDNKLLNLTPYNSDSNTNEVKNTKDNSKVIFVITLSLILLDKLYHNF